MNSELDEIVMAGSSENDYPNGDFVCFCHECGVDFHGPQVTICYTCQGTGRVLCTKSILLGYIAALATVLVILFL